MYHVIWVGIIFPVLFLTGCHPAPEPVSILSQFDPSEVSFIHDEGTNTVEGQAFLRQQGGNVVTCAGQDVTLLPVGSYSQERIEKLYGTNSQPALARARIEDPDPAYLEYLRKTQCDAQGNFHFERVADGRYFIVTRVVWKAVRAGSLTDQGGAVMAPVQVMGGEHARIIIAP